MEALHRKEAHKWTQKIIVEKHMPKFLVATGTANTNVANIFEAHRSMATHWIKENELANAFEYSDDDVTAIGTLKKIFIAAKKLGEFCARSVIFSKGMKVKQNRLRSMLRTMKRTFLLGMILIQRRLHENRSANAVWHLGTARKFIISGMIDGCSRKSAWSKCSNNNKSETTCDFFLKI